MIRMLRNRDINGFILDRHTLTTFYHILENDADGDDHMKTLGQFKEEIAYLKSDTMQMDLSYHGESMSMGIIVKQEDDYEYFADYVKDNSAIINVCIGLIINNLTAHSELNIKTIPEDVLFEIYDDLFWPTLLTITTALGLIICFGVVYEIHRRSLIKCWKPSKCNVDPYIAQTFPKGALSFTDSERNENRLVFVVIDNDKRHLIM